MKTDKKELKEQLVHVVLSLCACVCVIAVLSISAYMFISGTPALFKVGIKEILFNTHWDPVGITPSYGILNMILTSITGVLLSLIIAVPIGILTAIYINEIAGKKMKKVLKGSVELLAGIPSVVYGLLGIVLVNPVIYKLELMVYKGSSLHQFSGGANLLSAVIVLSIMILPTLINMSINALEAVDDHYRKSSLALGATHIQTIFKVTLPSAKKGLVLAVVLGVGRAIGEAMAILLVSGNSVNGPELFNSVRFLTTGIVSEMSYSSGIHREVLYTIGLVLFVFILVINILMAYISRKEK